MHFNCTFKFVLGIVCKLDSNEQYEHKYEQILSRILQCSLNYSFTCHYINTNNSAIAFSLSSSIQPWTKSTDLQKAKATLRSFCSANPSRSAYDSVQTGHLSHELARQLKIWNISRVCVRITLSDRYNRNMQMQKHTLHASMLFDTIIENTTGKHRVSRPQSGDADTNIEPATRQHWVQPECWPMDGVRLGECLWLMHMFYMGNIRRNRDWARRYEKPV